jgi:FkbM family methyltransferase
MNLIDIGAGKYNKYSDWLVKHPLLKIYAFEPHPENFEKLKSIKDTLDQQSQKRLFLFDIAISSVNGEIPFYINNDRSSSSVHPMIQENVKRWKYPIGRTYFKPIKTINVKSMTLQTALENNRIHHIEMLNIDTQGDSLQILESLDFKHYSMIKQILVKAHSPGCVKLFEKQCDSYDVITYLKRRYFQLFKTMNYSNCQEQLLNFLNEPMKNRGAKLHGFTDQ